MIELDHLTKQKNVNVKMRKDKIIDETNLKSMTDLEKIFHTATDMYYKGETY